MVFIREPIKNWFGFNRRERRASFILLLLVILILIIRIIVPEKNIDIEDISAGRLLSEDSFEFENIKGQASVKPFLFDPNTASYDTLIKLGLAEKEAKTLINYRNKGGKFRQPSDIKKVYGIEGWKAEQLVLYIEVKADTIKKSRAFSSGKQKPLIDLNSCDTAQLVTLPGIGPVLSARIIKYRHLLGGFARTEQLKEVYGLPEETYNRIKGRLYADTSSIIRISVNSADYKELVRIPYIEKYEVAAILKYRELKHTITGISDLTENKLITEEKAVKIRPYLRFE